MLRKWVVGRLKESENIRKYFSPKLKMGSNEIYVELPQDEKSHLHVLNNKPLKIGGVEVPNLSQNIKRNTFPNIAKPNKV